jgi:hypothetical protein
MTQNNLELMRTLDDSWNAQDWDTFEKRHSKDTTVFGLVRPSQQEGATITRRSPSNFSRRSPTII